MTAPKLPDDVREKVRSRLDELMTAPFIRTLDELVDGVFAALSESGRVVVPREPDFRTIVAGRKALAKRPSERNYALIEEIYRAMIAEEEGT